MTAPGRETGAAPCQSHSGGRCVVALFLLGSLGYGIEGRRDDMPEWSEVAEARRLALEAQGSLQTYAGQIEDGRESNLSLMLALATDAICLRLLADAIYTAYHLHDVTNP